MDNVFDALRDVDVIMRDEGSLVLLVAQNKTASDWFAEHVDRSGYQPWLPATVVVEPRYVDDILHGLVDAGFEVRA